MTSSFNILNVLIKRNVCQGRVFPLHPSASIKSKLNHRATVLSSLPLSVCEGETFLSTCHWDCTIEALLPLFLFDINQDIYRPLCCLVFSLSELFVWRSRPMKYFTPFTFRQKHSQPSTYSDYTENIWKYQLVFYSSRLAMRI